VFDIIVPVYRVNPDWVSECLESIKAQTYPYWRCIIVNGTPDDWEGYDDLLHAISDYCLEDSRFWHTTQTGSGVSQARNQGVSTGHHPYLAFLDADDTWYPDHLTFMMEAILDAPSHTAVWANAADIEVPIPSDKTGEIHTIKSVAGYYETYKEYNVAHHYYYMMGHPPFTSNVVTTRKDFEAVDGFDESLQMWEDTECWMRILQLGKRFVQLDSIGGFHRLGEHQTTRFGSQSSAYTTGESKDVLIKRFQDQIIRIENRHPLPTMDDKPDRVSTQYWEMVIQQSVGVNRSQVIGAIK
jgi:GT2 family glycosyltransferase